MHCLALFQCCHVSIWFVRCHTFIQPATMGWICSSGCYFLFPTTDHFQRFIPFWVLAITSGMVPLTGRAIKGIGCAVVHTVVARALAAGFQIRAPVFLMVILLKFAVSQGPLSLIKPIRKTCFMVYAGNAAAEQCFCVRLARGVDGH